MAARGTLREVGESRPAHASTGLRVDRLARRLARASTGSRELHSSDGVVQELGKMGDAQLVRDSYAMARAVASDLPLRFCRHLAALSGETSQPLDVAEFQSQALMMTRPLEMAVQCADDLTQLQSVFEELGRRHLESGVQEEHYPLISVALGDTLREVLGDHWTLEHESAWNRLLDRVTTMMTSGKSRASSSSARPSASMSASPMSDAYMTRFSSPPEAPPPAQDHSTAKGSEAGTISVSVSYEGEEGVDVARAVNTAPFSTVLDAALEHHIPHVHECGGKAKCTTCRVLVLEGNENLLPRTVEEERIAQRRAFPPEVRLACQSRVSGPVKVRRLVLDQQDALAVFSEGAQSAPREAQLAVLFADIRGFTTLSSEALPYDIVHALNRYFSAVCEEVDKHDGYVDKYMGDGLMALFGLAPSDVHPAEAAARAAIGMQKAMPELNRYLESKLAMHFRIGVGIHYGPVVVGELGFRLKKQFTGIGDTVNVASRVEGKTKEVGAPILITNATLEHLDPERFATRAPVSVHLAGKSDAWTVHPLMVEGMDAWAREECARQH